MQRGADQFVGDVGTVELRGVDVIDAQFDRAAQHGQRFVAVARRAERIGPGQLHGTEADAVDRKPTEWKGIHTVRLASKHGHISRARRATRW